LVFRLVQRYIASDINGIKEIKFNKGKKLSNTQNTFEKQDEKKTIRLFAAASFLNDIGSDIIYPIWPLFVTSFLGANMAVLGLIDGLGEAIVSIAQAASGFISDRIRKRKVFVWVGYLMGSLSRIGYALAPFWQLLIPFKILDRAGKIRNAPRDAIIADISTRGNRGQNFGILRAMDNSGAVVGILICIFLFQYLRYQWLFLLAAIPSVIGAFIIFRFIKEEKATDGKIFKGFSLKQLDTNFKLLMLLSSFFALGSFSYSFLIIYAREFGFQETFVPVLYLIFSVIASIFSIPFGKLADRFGRKPVLFLSFILWALVCLNFMVSQSYWVVMINFILYGLHKGALEPVQKTFVAELAPVAYRASSLGAFQMIIGLCALPASFIAGLLWSQVNLLAPVYLSFGLTFIAVVLLFFVKET